VNDPEEVRRFLAAGVASITTDDPEAALAIRNGEAAG
jgi:glycerophosphoryl diester phosphodiesterase